MLMLIFVTPCHRFMSLCFITMGATCITSLHPKFNGSHFGLPPSSIHRMTGWVAISRIQWRMRTAPIVYKKVNARKISTIPERGLFTKWSRSGLRGTFQVHAGCVAGCVRPRKTHPGRATSCSFCMNRLWVIQTISVWEELEKKTSHRKNLEQDIFFTFRIDDSEQCGTQNSVQHCRVPCMVTRTAVVGGKRGCSRWSPTANQWFFWLYSTARHYNQQTENISG